MVAAERSGKAKCNKEAVAQRMALVLVVPFLLTNSETVLVPHHSSQLSPRTMPSSQELVDEDTDLTGLRGESLISDSIEAH